MALSLLIKHSFERFNQVASLLVHIGEVLLCEVVFESVTGFIVKLQHSLVGPYLKRFLFVVVVSFSANAPSSIVALRFSEPFKNKPALR